MTSDEHLKAETLREVSLDTLQQEGSSCYSEDLPLVDCLVNISFLRLQQSRIYELLIVPNSFRFAVPGTDAERRARGS